jgi:hypothetical protein
MHSIPCALLVQRARPNKANCRWGLGPLSTHVRQEQVRWCQSGVRACVSVFVVFLHGPSHLRWNEHWGWRAGGGASEEAWKHECLSFFICVCFSGCNCAPSYSGELLIVHDTTCLPFVNMVRGYEVVMPSGGSDKSCNVLIFVVLACSLSWRNN